MFCGLGFVSSDGGFGCVCSIAGEMGVSFVGLGVSLAGVVGAGCGDDGVGRVSNGEPDLAGAGSFGKSGTYSVMNMIAAGRSAWFTLSKVTCAGRIKTP